MNDEIEDAIKDAVKDRIKVGIIGGAGYTAGELIRILLNHPQAQIAWVHSSSNAGNRLDTVHQGLIGETDMTFSEEYDLEGVDVVFMCCGHGQSQQFWQENLYPSEGVVIDLSQDFRDQSAGYIYALPELKQQQMPGAKLVANPGCFATAIELSLLPLAAAGELNGKEIHVTAITGSTGAGVKPSATTHFSWRTDNISVYKPFQHQHLKEIQQTLKEASGQTKDFDIAFIPVRGDFARGIYAMTYVNCDLSKEEVVNLYKDFYREAPFVHVTDQSVDLKQAVNTNKAIINVSKHDGRVLITTAIDNLIKGASGQAVQNMNIIFGLPEKMGLNLKPSAF